MTPANGGGNGQVWVKFQDTPPSQGGLPLSRKNEARKYMREQDATKEGDHAAKNEH
jgi:hypothetical protein